MCCDATNFHLLIVRYIQVYYGRMAFLRKSLFIETVNRYIVALFRLVPTLSPSQKLKHVAKSITIPLKCFNSKMYEGKVCWKRRLSTFLCLDPTGSPLQVGTL